MKLYLGGTYHVTEWQNAMIFYISAKYKQNRVKNQNYHLVKEKVVSLVL